MDTGPQKESDTPQEAGRETKKKERRRKRAKRKKHFKRPGQRDRWEMTAVQAERRQIT